METDLTGFNHELINANKSHGYLIKPLVRLVNYWNAKNRYPFESFSLERDIVRNDYLIMRLLGNHQLKDYFHYYIEGMNIDSFAPKWKREKVSRAHRLIAESKYQELLGRSIPR